MPASRICSANSKTGRNFIGIECDEGYFEVVRARIAEAGTKIAEPIQPMLFAAER